MRDEKNARRRTKLWIKNNRLRFNALVLPHAKKYQKRIYHERKEKGLCSMSGKRKLFSIAFCRKCLKKHNSLKSKTKEEKNGI